MSIGTRIKELQIKRQGYQDELDNLHLSEPSEKWYRERRYELESYIVMIDDAIDDLEKEQKMLRPFLWTLIGFAVVASAFLLVRIILN